MDYGRVDPGRVISGVYFAISLPEWGSALPTPRNGGGADQEEKDKMGK